MQVNYLEIAYKHNAYKQYLNDFVNFHVFVYANTDIQIQTYKYKYTNTNIVTYKHTNTNIHTHIQTYNDTHICREKEPSVALDEKVTKS